MFSSQLKISSGLNIALPQDPCYTPLATLFTKSCNYFANEEVQVTPWQVSITTLFNSLFWHCYFNHCYVQMAQSYPDMCWGLCTHQPGQSVWARSDKPDSRSWIWHIRGGSCEHLEASTLLTKQAKWTNAMESNVFSNDPRKCTHQMSCGVMAQITRWHPFCYTSKLGLWWHVSVTATHDMEIITLK